MNKVGMSWKWVVRGICVCGIKKGGYLIIISNYKKEIKKLNERIKNSIFASHGLIEMNSGQSDHS